MAGQEFIDENKLIELITEFKGKSITLLAHHNADIDSIGSGIILKSILEYICDCSVNLGAVESVSKLAVNAINNLKQRIEINPDLSSSDLIVLLDMSTPGQLSSYLSQFNASTAKKLIIDHHAKTDKSIEVDWIYSRPEATSTIELILSISKKLDYSLTKEEAKILLQGIIADTGHLKYATSQTFSNVGEILSNNDLSYQDVLQSLNMPTDVSEKTACLKAGQRLKMHKIKNFLIVTSKISSYEASAARSLIRLGADLAAVAAVREKENEIRISIRATKRLVDSLNINIGNELISGVAKIIEGSGSGHVSAAGANGKNINKFDDAFKFIINYISEHC